MPLDHRYNDEVEDGWFTRDRLRLLVLLAGTAILAYICLLIVRPFMPALAWALALGVVGYPLHEWIVDHVPTDDIAAGLSVAAVALILVGPAILIGQQLFSQGRQIVQNLDDENDGQSWSETLASNPATAPFYKWVDQHLNVRQEIRNAASMLRSKIGDTLRGTFWFVAQLLVCLFALFFFFRDKREIMRTLRSLVPLSSREVDEVFGRIRAMVRATIYGTVVVAAVQGGLGGLMFWILGLPAPLLWGVVMAVLALIPIFGAFVIWAPAAVWLLIQGDIAKAVILAAWGTIVVSLIDNLLYPMLVGREMRLHTLPVFLAIVGGLFVFGASGVVLGPVTLAVLLAIIEILRRRTTAGRPAEQPS